MIRLHRSSVVTEPNTQRGRTGPERRVFSRGLEPGAQALPRTRVIEVEVRAAQVGKFFEKQWDLLGVLQRDGEIRHRARHQCTDVSCREVRSPVEMIVTDLQGRQGRGSTKELGQFVEQIAMDRRAKHRPGDFQTNDRREIEQFTERISPVCRPGALEFQLQRLHSPKQRTRDGTFLRRKSSTPRKRDFVEILLCSSG